MSDVNDTSTTGTERKSVTLNLSISEAKLVVGEMENILEGSTEHEGVREDAQSVVEKVNRQVPIHTIELETQEDNSNV